MKLPTMHGLGPEPKQWHSDQQPSAVCLLFIEPTDSNIPHVVFTKRSTKVGSHKGQVSFPGGRADETDATPTRTALRELHEELGVPPESVSVSGSLECLGALDRSPVITIVASTKLQLTDFNISPDEVSEVFALPWTELTREKSKPFKFNIFGEWRESQLFGEKQPYPIWGLTAQLLYLADFN